MSIQSDNEHSSSRSRIGNFQGDFLGPVVPATIDLSNKERPRQKVHSIRDCKFLVNEDVTSWSLGVRRAARIILRWSFQQDSNSSSHGERLETGKCNPVPAGFAD